MTQDRATLRIVKAVPPELPRSGKVPLVYDVRLQLSRSMTSYEQVALRSNEFTKLQVAADDVLVLRSTTFVEVGVSARQLASDVSAAEATGRGLEGKIVAAQQELQDQADAIKFD